jgi:selenium binding protein SBP56
MDCETFDILGRWEIDPGPQKLHYDFWWNLPRDYMCRASALPPQFENGIARQELFSASASTASHDATSKSRSTCVDASLPPDECDQGFSIRFVLRSVSQHARPLRSCSLVDFLTIGGAQDDRSEWFLGSRQIQMLPL